MLSTWETLGVFFKEYIYTNFVSLPSFFNEKYCSYFLMMPYSTYKQVSHNTTGNISTALHQVSSTRFELETLYDLPVVQCVSIAYKHAIYFVKHWTCCKYFNFKKLYDARGQQERHECNFESNIDDI